MWGRCEGRGECHGERLARGEEKVERPSLSWLAFTVVAEVEAAGWFERYGGDAGQMLMCSYL